MGSGGHPVAGSEASGIAQNDRGGFLAVVTDTLAALLELCQFGRDHAGATEKVKGGVLGFMNLAGNAGREPQTNFRFTRAERLPYGILVIGPKRRLIKKFGENSRLRFEKGIHGLGRYFRPLRDPFDGHSSITFALQELPRGFDDAPAGIP